MSASCGSACCRQGDAAEQLDPHMHSLLQKMRDSMPPYDGTDPNTSQHWYCKACFTPEQDDVRLRRCARCKVVSYCSRECQRNDFPDHDDECKTIAAVARELRAHAEQLRHHTNLLAGPDDPPENLFHTGVGKFWLIFETRDYCRTRHRLASLLQDVAHVYEVKPLLDIVLSHRLDILRLVMRDNIGLRNLVPFTLLSLNRDDDCVAFITHWLRRLSDPHDPQEEMEALYESSRPGDWIYGQGDRYADVLGSVPDFEAHNLPLAFLAALCIVKLRLIAEFEARVQHFLLFEATEFAKALGDSLVPVREAYGISEADEELIARQEQLVSGYMEIIKENNPTLLPAIINPGPLKSQPPPQYFEHGKPSEAWGVLMDSNRLFVRIPGVEARLRDMFGERPEYDFVVDTLGL